jgi:hypothetical protein
VTVSQCRTGTNGRRSTQTVVILHKRSLSWRDDYDSGQRLFIQYKRSSLCHRLASFRRMACSPVDHARPRVTALPSPGRSFPFLIDERNQLSQGRRAQFGQAKLYRAS